MDILITEEQLKSIIREGRYSNPLFFKLAGDLFDEFYEYVKTPLEENNFYELVKTIAENPEIELRKIRDMNLWPKYLFRVNDIVKKNELEEYLKLIDKDNRKLIDFINKIYNNKLVAYFGVDFSFKLEKDANTNNHFYENKLSFFNITLYRNSFITYGLKDKIKNTDYKTSEIILDLKNRLIDIITHELQHVYDSFNSWKASDDKEIVKSDKDFYNFYKKTLKNDLSKIKFNENKIEDERIKELIKYHFEKREIWARIQQYFNTMNLENPEHLIFFYKEMVSGHYIIHDWAKRFFESVIMNRINQLKLDEKIEIPIDKFRRYIYKIFYQMLTYKVKLLIDERKKNK